MAQFEDFSEYDGDGVMPNTVYPKGPDALTNGDKLRLQSLTGQEDDSRAPIDPYHWTGGRAPDPRAEKAVVRAREQKARQIRRAETARYKETPSQY